MTHLRGKAIFSDFLNIIPVKFNIYANIRANITIKLQHERELQRLNFLPDFKIFHSWLTLADSYSD